MLILKTTPDYNVVQRRLRELREKLKKAALEGNSDLHLAVPPGVGKSYILKEYAVEVVRGGGAAAYVVPFIRLAEEVARSIVGAGVAVVRGRNPQNCRLFSELKELRELGYGSRLLCSTCPYEETCEYWSELRRALEGPHQILICTPQTFPIVAERRKGLRAVIWDEHLERAVALEGTTLTRLKPVCEELGIEEVAEAFAEAIDATFRYLDDRRIIFLVSKAHAWMQSYGGREKLTPTLWDFLSEFGYNPQEIRDAIEKALGEYKLTPSLLWSWFEKRLCLKAYLWLQGALTGRSFLWIQKGKAPRLCYYTLPEVPENARLLTADYNLPGWTVSEIFGRKMKEISGTLPLHVPVKLVRVSAGKTSTVGTSEEAAKRRELVSKCVQSIVEAWDEGKYLVVCHKAIKSALQRAVKPPQGVKVTWKHHFGSLRGLNHYADYKGVLVVLRPVTSPLSILGLLYALNISGEKARELLEELSYREAVQELCRARPHLREEETELWLLGDFKPGWFRQLLECRLMMGRRLSKTALAHAVAEVVLKTLGFVSPQVLAYLGVGRPKSPEERQAFWQKVSEAHPKLVSELSFRLQALMRREALSLYLSSSFTVPTLLLKILEGQGTVTESKPTSCQVSGKQSSSQSERSRHGSQTYLRVCAEASRFPNLPKGGFPLELWPFEIAFTTKSWWRKLLELFPPETSRFVLEVRTVRGNWSRTTCLGSPDAARAFLEPLGLWGEAFRLPKSEELRLQGKGKGLVYYAQLLVEEAKGGGDEQG